MISNRDSCSVCGMNLKRGIYLYKSTYEMIWRWNLTNCCSCYHIITSLSYCSTWVISESSTLSSSVCISQYSFRFSLNTFTHWCSIPYLSAWECQNTRFNLMDCRSPGPFFSNLACQFLHANSYLQKSWGPAHNLQDNWETGYAFED